MISSILGLVIGLLVVVVVIVGIIVLIVRLASRSSSPQPFCQQPQVPPMTAPGWYPDAQNPSVLRYFDGRVWTQATQPRGGQQLPPG